MENFTRSDFQEQCGAQILLATNVLRCANGNNNNNNLTKKGDKIKANEDGGDDEQKLWKCSCVGVGTAAGYVEDKGGGGSGQRLTHKIEIDETEKNAENGATGACGSFENHYGLYDAGAYDSDEAAAIDFHSNRNSRNNSTDNLSYASDQFYAKDLIFLEDDYDEDDDDNGASLNSDDCVYAYRGDGTDFDFPLEAVAGRPAGIAADSMDDEMDFLEMDFDPDTLSEIENGGNSMGSGALPAAVAATDALLLQRDISQLDGRHSSRNSEICNVQQQQLQQRQLFSSPIDDLSTTAAAPIKLIASQTLLGKNFGRMSLHLDQIQGSGGDIPTTKPLGCESGFERLNGLNGSANMGVDAVSSISSSVGANHTKDLVIDFPSTAAHSLPNTLHAFGRETNEVVANNKTSPIKVTGAKPKRLSTFSTSSSTSSKNSCKSRTSLRSVIGPSLYNSASFDERSVSCTEFRSAPPPLSIADDTTALANSANVLAANQLDPNEESSCLDCLEKEFLASTIGKALEPSNCPKCRRKRYTFSKMEFSSNQQSSQQHHHQHQSLRCRSGSPSFFTDIASDSFYEFSHENWMSGGLSSLSLLPVSSSSSRRAGDVALPIASTVFKCDILGGDEQLRKKSSSDKESVTISLADLSEEIVISSLEQLQVAYQADLIKFYFESLRQSNLLNNSCSSSSSNSNSNDNIKSKEFQDLKHFLLHESKRNCNHPKLKRLIEHVTQQQVDVQFKENTNKTDAAMINVSATDILRHWTRNNDILCLQQLDQRFKRANVLGKVANLIRQTQTKRPSSMRTQIEFIAIPQYYPDGYLVLQKKQT